MTDAEIEALTMHLSDPDNRPVVQPELALRLIARLDAERARAEAAEARANAVVVECLDFRARAQKAEAEAQRARETANRRKADMYTANRRAEAKLAKAREALKSVGIVPSVRHTSGHLYDCAWCNGSAEIAKSALAALDDTGGGDAPSDGGEG